MKNLIHSPQFRALANASYKLEQKLKSPPLLQQIFSKSFLKKTKWGDFLEKASFGLVWTGIALSTTAFFFYGLLWGILSLLFTSSVVFSCLYLEFHQLLASDKKKENIIQKLEKILVLHPHAEEIIAPTLDLLKNDVSFSMVEDLEHACNDILLNMKDERVGEIETVFVQSSESVSQMPEKSETQRFVV